MVVAGADALYLTGAVQVEVCLLYTSQVRHILRRVTKLVGDQAVVDVIDGPSYGRCDGAAVLKQAEDLYAGK